MDQAAPADQGVLWDLRECSVIFSNVIMSRQRCWRKTKSQGGVGMIKRAITISLLVVLALASSSLAQQVIKVGSVPIVHELPLRAAMGNGYFAQEGIKIEPEVMAGGGVLVPALLGGLL